MQHIKLPENCTWGDLNEACALCDDFNPRISNHYASMGNAFCYHELSEFMYREARIIGEKLPLLDDMSKDVMRQLFISRGVYQILHAQERGFFQLSSSTNPDIFKAALMPLAYLIDQLLEHPNGGGLSNIQVNQMLTSPRELVRFFHRRCACSCLKNIYYTLKDNTSKMTVRHGCKTANEAKDVFECECKYRNYCSRECAKND